MKNVGTYYVTITFNGETIRKKYTITPINGGTITIPDDPYTYDGNEHKPEPTVTAPLP